MVQHYGTVNGNAQAGAVTYFGFLSFFPILALGFFVVGLLAQVYPDLKDQMVAEINNLLPGRDRHRRRARSSCPPSSPTPGMVGLVGLVVVCCTPASAGSRACGRPSR